MNSMDSEEYTQAKKGPVNTGRAVSRNSLAIDSGIHSVYKPNKSPSDYARIPIKLPHDEIEIIDNMLKTNLQEDYMRNF